MSRIDAICDADARKRSPILRSLAASLSAERLNEAYAEHIATRDLVNDLASGEGYKLD